MEALERIIRPIVEGQIRGFLKEHPVIVAAVDWYKPGKDKSIVFTNSLSKRIVRDLTCPTNEGRLAAALVAPSSATQPRSTVALGPCGEVGPLGMNAERADAVRAMDGI